MTAQTDFSPETVEDLYALWDQLRAAAISENDRHEIDDIFADDEPPRRRVVQPLQPVGGNGGAARTGTISVAGKTVTVQQSAP